MAVQFKVPKSPAKSVYQINEFKGVDFSNSPANIDDNKSPNAVNMIRDVPDKVRKRMGYEVLKRYGANLLNNTAESANIFTVNKDKSVTIEGTGSYTLTLMSNLELKAGRYVLRGIEPSGETFAYGIYLNDGNEDIGAITNLGTEVVEIEEDTEVTVELRVAGSNLDVTVYPAIYAEDNESPEYVPYFTGSTNVNGVHYRREDKNDEDMIYHIGTKLIKNNVVLYSNANDAISHSWQFSVNMYFLDGKKFLKYDGDPDSTTYNTIFPVQDSADTFVPTLIINKDAGVNGAGVTYDSINLLTRAFMESFVVTSAHSTEKKFYLSQGNLADDLCTAWVLQNDGSETEMEEGHGFSVDRTNGIITFDTAPGVSPLNGHDNVRIKAWRTDDPTDPDDPHYADKINHCTFGTRFGVNGAFDRLFVSGNPDFPNSDWYSGMWDCTYFPDLGYTQLGSSRSAVVGYSIISNYLAAHKDEMEQDLSIILRQGDYITNEQTGIDEPSFKIINTLQGAGAIATNSFAYLCTEPLFLTRSGLYAVTAQDITGEKYAQSRSFYLNGKLTAEAFEKLQDSFACIFNDMYLLSVDHDRLYVLDGLQPIRTDKSEPYATRQYVAFYCDNLPIHYMWEKENRLFFGTQDGRICRFYKDKESQWSYSDDGEAIRCQWETPDIDGQLFYKNKSLRYIAIRVGAALATSVEIWVMDRGIWKFVKQDNTFGRYFSFSNLIFSKVAFSGNKTQKISRTKVRVKRVDKYRLRFANNELNEPFSLYNIANEYTESGNYKG